MSTPTEPHVSPACMFCQQASIVELTTAEADDDE